MNRDVAAVVFIAAVAALTWATALASTSPTILQVGRAFHPGEITIDRGTTIDISNQDEFIHQIYVDSDGFNYDSKEQSPGEIFHIAFPAPGTFPVRCHIHPKMLLMVHVK